MNVNFPFSGYYVVKQVRADSSTTGFDLESAAVFVEPGGVPWPNAIPLEADSVQEP